MILLSLALASAITCNSPRIEDGDTLYCSGTAIRLFGINAPEIAHPDHHKPLDEPGGREAQYALLRATRRPVSCYPTGAVSYHRLVARCYVVGPASPQPVDLSEWLLRNHLACRWDHYAQGAYWGLGQKCGPFGRFTYIGPPLSQLQSH